MGNSEFLVVTPVIVFFFPLDQNCMQSALDLQTVLFLGNGVCEIGRAHV